MIKFKVCKTSELPVGEMKLFVIDGKDLLIANVSGSFYCVQNTCTHREASLSEGILLDCSVICPLHAAQFDLKSGKASFGLPILDLKTYPIFIENENIFIGI